MCNVAHFGFVGRVTVAAARVVALQVSAEEDLIVTIDLATGRIRTSLRKRLVIIE